MRVMVFLVLLMPLAVSAGGLLQDRANLKVLKARSQVLLLNQDNLEKNNPNGNISKESLESVAGQAGCGSVDIGNQSVDKTLTGDINIVITGDVINTGNRCSQF